MIALEVGNLNGLVFFLVLILIGPPIILTLIGFGIKKNSPNSAKTLFILAALYLVIGLGICGSLLSM
jgi:hypothetical protein